MEDDWSKEFKSLLDSPLGQELLRTLREDVHDNLIKEAEAADTQEKAFGLLKQAAGVISTVEHLQFRAVVSKDGESRSNNY